MTDDDSPSVRQQVLQDAGTAVLQDRNTSYGGPEQSFEKIAAYWAILFGHPVSASQVALALGLLKIARLQANPTHQDSWVDLAGYAACGAEVAQGGR